MTAAQCTENFRAPDLKVLAGDSHLYDDHATQYDVLAIHNHPRYKKYAGDGIDYDFSILELAYPIDLTGSSKARAVCLPEDSDTDFNSDTKFVVSGWGKLDKLINSNFPNALYHASVPWVSQDECNKSIGRYLSTSLSSYHICAGGKGGVNFCVADIGGKHPKLCACFSPNF
jgi:hypothetical protein